MLVNLTGREHLEVEVEHENARSIVLGEVYPLRGCMSCQGDQGLAFLILQVQTHC